MWICSSSRPARTRGTHGPMRRACRSSLLKVFNRRCGSWQRIALSAEFAGTSSSLTTRAICGEFVTGGGCPTHARSPECWLVVRGDRNLNGGKEAHTRDLRRLLLPAGGSLRARRQRALPDLPRDHARHTRTTTAASSRAAYAPAGPGRSGRLDCGRELAGQRAPQVREEHAVEADR